MTTETKNTMRQWKVTPRYGRGKKNGNAVYVNAVTVEGAERAARILLTMFGESPKNVTVVAWSPETDHELASVVRRRTKPEVRPATSADWDAWRDGRLG